MKLLIVESPSKCKKIKSFLGADYQCVASVGHIVDIQQGLKGIHPETFLPSYTVKKGKKRIVHALQQQCRGASHVFLATDPDREGEAIAYHLCLFLGLCPKTTPRVRFHEITKTAVQHAMNHPTVLDMNLVRAQQARQVLDLYVGYKVSPLLWKAVAPKLSAGRCQTPALRMLRDQERVVKDPRDLKRRLVVTADLDQGFSGCILHQPRLVSWDDVSLMVSILAKTHCFEVLHKTTKTCRQDPPPPFITSTMQQESYHLFHLSPTHTMAVLQTLYEKGRITYMRTDSPFLSETAVQQCQQCIEKKFGGNHFFRRVFASSATSQEAHEAIRPTKMATETLPAGCTDLEKKLYHRIWKRTLASQMITHRFTESVYTILGAEKYEFQKTSRTTLQQGWKLVYDDDPKESSSILPDPPCTVQWMQGKVVEEVEKNKGRHSEATLIRELEKRGIGRPSTFASLGAKLLERKYASMGNVAGLSIQRQCLHLDKNFVVHPQQETVVVGGDHGKYMVTDRGQQVLTFLQTHVPWVVEDDFTGAMENELDKMARKETTYHEVVSRWFSKIDNCLFSCTL